jgi:energy-coupling factor transporter ATP-binding protein EcfA2
MIDLSVVSFTIMYMSALGFRVEKQKALQLAECAQVPRLMIICGANGSGKSTLLWSLKQRLGLVLDPTDTQVLYQPPHRAIRKQTVQRRWVGGALTSYSDSLSLDSVAAPEGIQIPYPSRSPDNVDESGSTIKHTLAKLENKRQSYITNKFDAASQSGAATLDMAQVKNIFAPLSEIVARLLPHLEFTRINFEQEDNIKVVFERKEAQGVSTTLDLDDLSSGEKAVVLLFLPLVEAEIRSNLEHFDVDQTSAPSVVPDRLFLLDEPELHLHPDLQRRMLAYMRERSSRDNIQFILITHSPTILDEANDEELYVLAPASGDQNQLHQAATPAERLNALRELTGESYFLSTGRNIVCCEGEVDTIKGKMTDRSLIELLTPRSSRYTFVSMGGKSQVVTAVKRLRDSLPIDKFGVAVVGLVDADQSINPLDGCVTWSFCEIENALLHPRTLEMVAKELDPNFSLTDSQILALINDAGQDIRNEEIQLRITRELGAKTVRAQGADVKTIRELIDKFIKECVDAYATTKIEEVCTRVTVEVDLQLSDGSFIRRFRGKRLLRIVFSKLNLQNIGFERFCYLLASRVREEPEIASTLDAVFADLDAQVDGQLAKLLVKSDEEPTVADGGAPLAVS